MFLINTAVAKDITVAILGAMPSSWEEEDFGQTTLYLTRAAEKRGEKVIIGAPFKMSFINGKNPNLEYFNIENSKHIKKLIQKIRTVVSPGDSVNLLIYGHGNPTRYESKHNQTSIQLSGERLRSDKLIKIINKNLPKNIGIKTIAPYCFSGSIHRLSYDRPNSCSAAASDFRTSSKGESSCFFGECEAIRSYGMDIGKIIFNNPKISLADAHEIVSESDPLNQRRGDLSSIDYIKRIFKKGPYKIRKNWLQQVFSDGPEETSGENYLGKVCSDSTLAHELTPEKLDSLIENTKEILNTLDIRNSFKQGVPSFVIDFIDRNFHRYKTQFDDESASYRNNHANVISNIEFHKESEKNGELTDWNDKIFLNRMKEELTQKTNELLRYELYRERIQLINLLYRKGTQDQIRKFEDLIRCENS